VKEVGLDIKDEKYEKEELQVLFDGGAE